MTGPLVNLDGRHAAVTGAAGGLGRAIARTLAGAGARVCVLDINAAVAFLASGAAAMITGVILPVDGGNLALNAGGSIGE